jgi:hypothetical protein
MCALLNSELPRVGDRCVAVILSLIATKARPPITTGIVVVLVRACILSSLESSPGVSWASRNSPDTVPNQHRSGSIVRRIRIESELGNGHNHANSHPIAPRVPRPTCVGWATNSEAIVYRVSIIKPIHRWL